MLVPVDTMLNTIPVIKTAINWDILELILSATQSYDFTISRLGLNILQIHFFMIESENKSVLKISDSSVLRQIFLKNSVKNVSTYRFWDSHTINKYKSYRHVNVFWMNGYGRTWQIIGELHEKELLLHEDALSINRCSQNVQFFTTSKS